MSLSSDNTSAATVPASVTVAAGATSATFPVTTSPVSGSTAVTISAVYGGVTRTAPLTVTPVAAGLSSLGGEPVQRGGGESFHGDGDADRSRARRRSGGVAVERQPIGGHGSSERDGGRRRHQRHVPCDDESGVRFHGRDDLGQYGVITRTATLTVNPPSLSSLSLSPSSVQGGSPSTGTVTLTGPAPSGGAVVSLSSSNTSVASVPANVTVPSGATSATFTISTHTVSRNRSVTISANYRGVSKIKTLTVTH